MADTGDMEEDMAEACTEDQCMEVTGEVTVAMAVDTEEEWEEWEQVNNFLFFSRFCVAELT